MSKTEREKIEKIIGQVGYSASGMGYLPPEMNDGEAIDAIQELLTEARNDGYMLGIEAQLAIKNSTDYPIETITLKEQAK